MIGGSLRPGSRAASEVPLHMHSRLLSRDEELGKRDDDFRPKRTASLPAASSWSPWRWRKRRVLVLIALLVSLYVFVRNIPGGLGPVNERLEMPVVPGHVAHGSQEIQEPMGAPPRTPSDAAEDLNKHYYDGPIKFYKLASSLRGISRTMGSKSPNRNILFAASSLKSVANLMPMVCEMAKWDRNYVHFSVFGRDAVPLEDILDVNGVDREECRVYFHDARGDYAEYSTDRRAEVSAGGAMKHINDFMHPQAVIMDDGSVEDDFFTRAMRDKASAYGHTLIEVPAGRYEDFLWMTRLDSGSLANWFKPTVDILIHAPPESSGGLIRLVKSLEQADYHGLKVPKLTVELPANIEPFAKQYLENLDWPPDTGLEPRSNTLALRHRIPSSRVSSEQASLRFLESFYPTSIENNHVLILSPQVEVSPLFAQYLHYLTLYYRYSSYGPPVLGDLLGLSLELPTTLLNGSGELKQPFVAHMHARKYINNENLDQLTASPFLYQAPSSTAILIFGDKWATLHNFVANRLAASHSGTAEKTKKLVAETEPAWLEYLLELMRARGWNVLQPASPLVTVHNELAQIPEEYRREKGEGQKGAEVLKQPDHPEEEGFLTAAEPPVLPQHVEYDTAKDIMPLHDLLPFDGELPELSHLPYVDYNGDLISHDRARSLNNQYAAKFRQQIGGCDEADAERKRVLAALRTQDLFCLPGVEPEYEEQIEHEIKVAVAIAEATAPAVEDLEEASTKTGVVRLATPTRQVAPGTTKVSQHARLDRAPDLDIS